MRHNNVRLALAAIAVAGMVGAALAFESGLGILNMAAAMICVVVGFFWAYNKLYEFVGNNLDEKYHRVFHWGMIGTLFGLAIAGTFSPILAAIGAAFSLSIIVLAAGIWVAQKLEYFKDSMQAIRSFFRGRRAMEEQTA